MNFYSTANTNHLYIIGNGFDIQHHLPTSYCDFKCFLHEELGTRHATLVSKYNSNTNYNPLNDASFYTNYKADVTLDNIKNFLELIKKYILPTTDLWNNFEQNLAYPDINRMYGAHTIQQQAYYQACETTSTPIDTDMDLLIHISKTIPNLKDKLLNLWIETIKYISIEKQYKLSNDSIYLTFNYTKTLEQVYGIDRNRILHIHGIQGDSNLILGHNKASLDGPEKDFDKQHNANKDIHKYLELSCKPVNKIIKTNKEWFASIKNIKYISIIGHSMNKVDMPYLRKIHENTTNLKQITLYYHGKKINDSLLDNLKKEPFYNKIIPKHQNEILNI